MGRDRVARLMRVMGLAGATRGQEAVDDVVRAPDLVHRNFTAGRPDALWVADFWRIVSWLRKRHVGLNMHTLVRRYLPGWEIRSDGIEMFRPRAVAVERYRYRGTKIPTPWSSEPTPGPAAQRPEHVESRMR